MAMTLSSSEWLNQLKTFYQACIEPPTPIEPDHPHYVPIFDNTPDRDPIHNLKTRILFAPSESVNLLTGFRGNGKSTQLRRLKRLLEAEGCKVYHIDMLQYMLMTKPMEISDLLLSIMTAFSEAVKSETGIDAVRRGYWERTREFLLSTVKLEDLNLKVGPDEFFAEIGLRLQRDASFKQIVQERLRGHTVTLINNAREFSAGIVDVLRKNNPGLKVVLLVDSLEQVRGQVFNAVDVQKSVAETLSGQAKNLVFPLLHVVYTIPPYLPMLAPGISKFFGGNSIACWPNIHVRNWDGLSDKRGITIMGAIVEKRFAGWRDFFDENHILRLAQSSGGDLRDFLRLVRECIIAISGSAAPSKVNEEIIGRVEQQLLNENLPIAIDDARWLLRIHQDKNAYIDNIDETPRLVRFQDGNLIMNYQNGEIWYDIHPLFIDEVKKLAALPQRTD